MASGILMKKILTLLLALAMPFMLNAGSSRHRSRRPDHRQSHESKHKLRGGSGSSHKGAHLAPGKHYDKKR
jgi:hypothetical protein